MFRLLLCSFIVFLLQWACHSPSSPTSSVENESIFAKSDSTPFYLGGIHINEASTEKWLNTLQEVGMNTTEVTIYSSQWMWDTDALEFEKNVEEAGELLEIREAKKKGMKVVVILRTQLQHWLKENHFFWHGMIMPKNDSLLLSWFEKYTEFNLKWAKICEEEGVDIMVIGSEMNALTSTVPLESMPWLYGYYNSWFRMPFNEKRLLKYKDILESKKLWVHGYSFSDNGKEWLEEYVEDKIAALRSWGAQVTFADEKEPLQAMNERRKKIKKYWIELIQKVRAVYQGQLTYAANYDNYQEVDFWEHLDFIGINAYFPLREPSDKLPSSEKLLANFEENWRNVFKEINRFKKNKHLSNKPLLFTELGYNYYVNSTVESWSGNGFALLSWGRTEKLVIWKEQEICGEERYWAVEALRRVFNSYDTDLQGILYWKLTTHEFLLREEPFALYIQTPSKDPLQNALVKFIKNDSIIELNDQNN